MDHAQARITSEGNKNGRSDGKTMFRKMIMPSAEALKASSEKNKWTG